jgi:hypothetical protein
MQLPITLQTKKMRQVLVAATFSLLSILATPLNTNASGLVLNWYSDYDYSDGQSLAFTKRLIVTASSSSIGTGFAKWCIAVDGQPFSMQGTQSISDDLTDVYLYFSDGVVSRSVSVQSEVGCWRVADASLGDKSYGFDITVPLKTLALGSRTITLTGHHRNGGTASKSIVINKIAPPDRPLSWGSFTGTGWGGSTHYTDGQTVTDKKRLIVEDSNLRGGFYNAGYLKWCVSLNGKPLLYREPSYRKHWGYLYDAQLSYSRQQNQLAGVQTEPGCWTIASNQLEHSANGIELVLLTSSWMDGQYSLSITGYHKTDAIGNKTFTFSTSNSNDRLSIAKGVTTASGTSTIPVTYSRMNPQDRVCLKRNGSAVDNTIKLDSQGPDANGCWQRTLPSGTQTLNFSANTLSWADGNYAFEVTIPADYPEVGSATATITSTNPPLGVTASGVAEGEPVSGPRQLTIGAQIASVHTSQFKPAKYCVDVNTQVCAFSSTTDAAAATYTFISHAYPDGPHRLSFKATDTAGREATKAFSFQIANGKPAVSGVSATTKAPNSPNGKASATVSFSAPKATAATVELTATKGRSQRSDIDLLSSLDGSAIANFENLEPSTKYNYKVTSRNANGESRAVTGTFTTPSAPKPAPRSRSGSSSGGSGSSSGGFGFSLIGWNLEDLQDALGYDPPTTDCKGWRPNLWSRNWWVIGVSYGRLVISKARGYCS